MHIKLELPALNYNCNSLVSDFFTVKKRYTDEPDWNRRFQTTARILAIATDFLKRKNTRTADWTRRI